MRPLVPSEIDRFRSQIDAEPEFPRDVLITNWMAQRLVATIDQLQSSLNECLRREFKTIAEVRKLKALVRQLKKDGK